MRIGELAQRTGTAVDTIRYYERIGLLQAPARTATNYRSYSGTQVERLQFIRRCRALDIPLAEVRDLVRFCGAPRRHCREVDALLDSHIRQLQVRIDALEVLARELRQLRAVCRNPGTADGCRILKSLRQAPPHAPGERPAEESLARHSTRQRYRRVAR